MAKDGTTLCTPTEAQVRAAVYHVNAALNRAFELGVLVEVRLVADKPLAMGNHHYEMFTRPARKEVDPL